MAPSAPTTTLSHNAANVAPQQAAQVQPGGQQNAGDILANAGLNAQQLIELLRNIPASLYNKVNIASAFIFLSLLSRFMSSSVFATLLLPTKAL